MSNLAPLVDELGHLKAQIAPLTKREAALKKDIKASGLDAIDGNLFRCTVSRASRKTLNSAKVNALLDELVEAGLVSRQRVASCFNRSDTETVRVSAQVAEVA